MSSDAKMADQESNSAIPSAQLVIFYDLGGGSRPFSLETEKIYCVGSKAPTADDIVRMSGNSGRPVDFIQLDGNSIAPNQFQLAYDGENWIVTRYGTTPVWLDNNELETIYPAPVLSDSVLKVPGATITLRIFRTQVSDGSEKYSNAWREVQDAVHKHMLNEFRLRSGNSEAERKKTTDDLKTDSVFIQTLGDTADGAVSRMAPDALGSAVSAALRKAIVAKVAGAKRVSEDLDDIPPNFLAQQINLYSERISGALGLSLERSQVNEDLETIKRDFHLQIRRALANMPRGDQLEIAKAFICGNIWDFIFNLGPITDLMKLEVVTEVMVVRYDKIFFERSGILEPYGYAFTSPEQLKVLIGRVANDAQRELTASNAMVDFRLRDGSRVNVIGEPLSVHGPAVTIRKHRGEIAWTLQQLVNKSSIDQKMAWFLEACVTARKNIVISGGTGTGKTTLLNALSAYIPADQRVVTIEDTAELILVHDHVVTLQGRPANTEGRNEVSIRMLVKNALRMRPDRIIVGECRGGEAVDMLQALNTGHSGSMTTAHANSPLDMLLRLEVMVLQGEPNLPSRAIRQQIASAVDIVVQITRAGGLRRVTEIAEVIGFDPHTSELIVEPIFVFQPDHSKLGEGRYIFTGLVPSFVDEIYRHRPLRDKEGMKVPVPIHEVFV